jgi:hypothetical protein
MRLLLGSGGFRTPERVAVLAEAMRAFFGCSSGHQPDYFARISAPWMFSRVLTLHWALQVPVQESHQTHQSEHVPGKVGERVMPACVPDALMADAKLAIPLK